MLVSILFAGERFKIAVRFNRFLSNLSKDGVFESQLLRAFCFCFSSFLFFFQARFSSSCMDFRRSFDKDSPGSWMINIIFLTCLGLSATCDCSLPHVGSSSLTFPQLPRSFPCFLSPWVCAAFSLNG